MIFIRIAKNDAEEMGFSNPLIKVKEETVFRSEFDILTVFPFHRICESLQLDRKYFNLDRYKIENVNGDIWIRPQENENE